MFTKIISFTIFCTGIVQTLSDQHILWQIHIQFLVPKADSKIVQPDLLGVALVFFSFIFILKSVSLSLHFHRPLGQHAYVLFSLAWAFVQVWSHQDPIVSTWSNQLNKQTNWKGLWGPSFSPFPPYPLLFELSPIDWANRWINALWVDVKDGGNSSSESTTNNIALSIKNYIQFFSRNSTRAVIKSFFSCWHTVKKILTCRRHVNMSTTCQHIIGLEILYKYRQSLRITNSTIVQ